jgi:DNA-binding MarR family transcriptional regulator
VPDSEAELLETLLARVMRLVSVHLDAPVSDVAGTALSAAEGSLLVELRTAGEVTQQQMADRLSIDKSRVSRLCAALERKDLLTRERDSSDRRNLHLRLTESGERAAARLRQAWRAYHDRMLTAMTSGERHALLVGLTAFARELATAHADQLGHPGGHDTDRTSPEGVQPGKARPRRRSAPTSRLTGARQDPRSFGLSGHAACIRS